MKANVLIYNNEGVLKKLIMANVYTPCGERLVCSCGRSFAIERMNKRPMCAGHYLCGICAYKQTGDEDWLSPYRKNRCC